MPRATHQDQPRTPAPRIATAAVRGAMISWVPYATEDSASELKTARAMGLLILVSWLSSLARRRPRRILRKLGIVQGSRISGASATGHAGWPRSRAVQNHAASCTPQRNSLWPLPPLAGEGLTVATPI